MDQHDSENYDFKYVKEETDIWLIEVVYFTCEFQYVHDN